MEGTPCLGVGADSGSEEAVAGMARTIYGDPERYVQQYWSQIPGMYFTGDGRAG